MNGEDQTCNYETPKQCECSECSQVFARISAHSYLSKHRNLESCALKKALGRPDPLLILHTCAAFANTRVLPRKNIEGFWGESEGRSLEREDDAGDSVRDRPQSREVVSLPLVSIVSIMLHLHCSGDQYSILRMPLSLRLFWGRDEGVIFRTHFRRCGISAHSFIGDICT